MADLKDFEGSPVTGARIEIRDAPAVAPVELHLGDEGIVALRYRVEKVRFDPTKGKRAVEGELVRVHVFSTREAMFMEDEELDERIRANALKVKLAVEEAAGKLHMNLDDDEPDEDDVERAAELVKAHEMGLHPHAAVVGCTSCDEREQDRTGDQRKDLQ